MTEDRNFANQNAKEVTGGCFCEAVRYEAEIYPHSAYYCHCRTCQKTTGAPAEVAVFVKPGTLRFTKEEPKYFQTSHFAKRGFCPHCGSRLVWISPKRPEWTNVPIGSLDNSDDVAPYEHVCVESQLSWYEVDDNLPRKRTEDIPDLVAAWEATE